MKIKLISPTAFFIASFFVLSHQNLDAFKIEIDDKNAPKLSEYTSSFAPQSIDWKTIDAHDTSAIGNEIDIEGKKYKIVDGVIQNLWKSARKTAEKVKPYDPLKLISIEKNDDNVILTYEYETLSSSGLGPIVFPEISSHQSFLRSEVTRMTGLPSAFACSIT